MGFRLPFLLAFVACLVAIVLLVVSFAEPTVSSGFTWAGCQLDSSYRFSADSGSVKKEECGGRPRQEEFEAWQKSKPKTQIRPSRNDSWGLIRGSPQAPSHQAYDPLRSPA